MKRLLSSFLSLVLISNVACSAEPSSTSAARAPGKNPVVVIETSMGTIKAELFEDKSPITVKNFLSYVDDKFYDGLTFHRVIPTFMIQGGGFLPGLKDAKNEKDIIKLEKQTKDPIKNEAANGLSNEKGTLAMARTGDPNSATAQFFINVVDNKRLDRSPRNAGYCVFGKVIEGMDVVEKIKGVKTKVVIPDAIEDVPVEEVIIKSVRRAQ
jgi:cyclophilin family peptidyl-prolyl cis-trans isomerase